MSKNSDKSDFASMVGLAMIFAVYAAVAVWVANHFAPNYVTQSIAIWATVIAGVIVFCALVYLLQGTLSLLRRI